MVFGEPMIFTTEARRTQREVFFCLPGDGGRQKDGFQERLWQGLY